MVCLVLLTSYLLSPYYLLCLLALQVSENEARYSAQLEELQQKLSHFERQCDQHESVLNATVQKNKAQIDKLQEEKAMLEVGLVLLVTAI